MWEARVLCELSKPLWESFFDFHRGVISMAAPFLCFVTSFGTETRGMLTLAPSADRRSYGLLRGRF